MYTKLLPLFLLAACPALVRAQDDCATRSFIISSSFNGSAFTVQTYQSDLLDSLYWDFGDGQTYRQTSEVGSGAAVHQYAAPGTYTVTLERWGVKDFPDNTTPLHCVFSLENTVYDTPTDSVCGGDFLTFVNGNTVTFSDQSMLQAPGFNSHSTEPLWDFGNGQHGLFINRIYQVTYAPGTYTACLYYGGFSYNNNGYLFDCETCQTFTVGGVSGVSELPAPVLDLYPNPATSFVDLIADRVITGADVELYDAMGRPQAIAPVASGSTLHFDVATLAAGSYYLRIRSGASVRTLSFVKL